VGTALSHVHRRYHDRCEVAAYSPSDTAAHGGSVPRAQQPVSRRRGSPL